MVEIISKRDGPRREDVQVKQLIEKNRATIVRLADQISGGGYSASKAPKPVPVPKGLIIHTGSRVKPVAEVSPSIRVSLNGRVIAMDENSGRQLEFFGEIRRRDGIEVFVLATKQNGFYAPLDDGLAKDLAALDGKAITTDYSEGHLSAEIAALLVMS
jgi:hypothetical protein